MCLQSYSLKSPVLCFVAENADTDNAPSYPNVDIPVKMLR